LTADYPERPMVPLPGPPTPDLADPERGEAMHVSRRRVLGIVVPVLLVSATATIAISLTARAQAYQDTSLYAPNQVTDGTFGGSSLTAEDAFPNGVGNGTDIALSGAGVTTWSLHAPPAGVVVSSTSAGAATISYQGSGITNPPDIIADAADGNGNIEALEIPVDITSNSIERGSDVPTLASVASLEVSDNSDHTLTFSARDPEDSGLAFAESNLPAGLTSGNPTLTYAGGTAAPGTYSGVKVSATDTNTGAVLTGTFTLSVGADPVIDNGDEVNKFGNGFDVFRQHEYAGARIVGWPASKSDPGTQFLQNNGSHAGAYQFEYAPNGSGSGLCVSDPGGGRPSDPLRDGLVLANCNSGPYQQFIPQSNGTLKNLATGLYVNPDGKGAQLRGESSRTATGGSRYTWTAEASLP
jgi:hypothetical protein